MKVSAQDVIMKCMEMGMMVTINQRLDMESIQYIASEFGFGNCFAGGEATLSFSQTFW